MMLSEKPRSPVSEHRKVGIDFITLSQTTFFFTLPNSKRWQKTILNLMKMAESSPNR